MGDLLNTIMELVADALRAIGLKRPGQKREIKADLELLQVLQATPGFGPDGETEWRPPKSECRCSISRECWCQGLDSPSRSGSFVTWLLIGGWFTYWTIQVSENGFSWWSIPTGFVASLPGRRRDCADHESGSCAVARPDATRGAANAVANS